VVGGSAAETAVSRFIIVDVSVSSCPGFSIVGGTNRSVTYFGIFAESICANDGAASSVRDMRSETDTDKANFRDGFFLAILLLLSHPIQIVYENYRASVRRRPPFVMVFFLFRSWGSQNETGAGFDLPFDMRPRWYEQVFLAYIYKKASQNRAGVKNNK
jgi:hypothetical protein